MMLRRAVTAFAVAALAAGVFGVAGAEAGLLTPTLSARPAARTLPKGIKRFTYHILYSQIATELFFLEGEETGSLFVCTTSRTWGETEACAFGPYENVKGRGGEGNFTYFHVAGSPQQFLFGYRDRANGWISGSYWYGPYDLGTFSTTRP